MKVLVFALVVLSFGSLKADFHKGACKEDVEKFCKDVPHGHGAVMNCLKEHHGELSEGCKANGQAMKEKMHDFKAACAADIKANCSSVKPGGKRIIQCLKDAPSVSEHCKAALPGK